MTDWNYVDQSELGISYYHKTIDGYKVEVHGVRDFIEIGIYSKKVTYYFRRTK